MSNEKNPIEQYYDEGIRIKYKDWDKGIWIEKHSDTHSINEKGIIEFHNWSFDNLPELWEVWRDDTRGDTATQPDAIRQAIDLLKSNGYEVYQIEKIKV
jgi:hypothetical protein